MSQHHPEREVGANFIELFFDLVFVYAITQVATLIEHDADLEGFLQATAIFTLVWWAWSQFTWTGNSMDVDDGVHRFAMFGATIAAFFMAQGLPDAFSGEGEWFSVPFAAAITIALCMYWLGLRGDPEHQRALLTYLPLAAIGTVLAGASGFVGDGLQEWSYSAAIGVLFLAGFAAQLGTPFHVYPKHFAERHGLIVIIALGESIIAVGVASAGVDRSADFAFALAVGGLSACVLWWSYFDWFQESLEEVLRSIAEHGRAPLARDLYTFGHVPIVLGIVGLAVAAHEMIAHPSDPLEDFGRFALAAGTALYLLGIVAAHLRATRKLLVERVAAAAIAIVLVAALPELDAIVAGSLLVVLHAIALGVERLRLSAYRPPA